MGISTLKKLGIAAATSVSLMALSSPAEAALQISFPTGATAGTFGDSDIAPTSSYSESQVFEFSSAGIGDFTISATTAFFKITSAYVDSVANSFTISALGPSSQAGYLEASFGAGFHKLFINGSVPAGKTGSYSGTINLTPSAVPEPAAWALMIGGFGIAGAGMRKRNRKTALSFA